jgi:hypothetical protein
MVFEIFGYEVVWGICERRRPKDVVIGGFIHPEIGVPDESSMEIRSVPKVQYIQDSMCHGSHPEVRETVGADVVFPFGKLSLEFDALVPGGCDILDIRLDFR